MKAAELRKKSTADLGKELLSLLDEQFKLRMQHATAQLSNTTKITTVRRSIARVRTVLTQMKKA